MHEDALAERFEQNRARLTAIAQRMLGSATEAQDAVQEAWLRASRADSDVVENMAGWLTTIVARICLTMLQSRGNRREDPLDEQLAEQLPGGDPGPADEAVLADSLGVALLVVLDRLSPAERLAFVLHDLFAVPFEEIAPIVDRSPQATRQLASRARRRVRGADIEAAAPDRRHAVVAAFLQAARGGDFDALLRLLAPDAVLRADHTAVLAGAGVGLAAETHGAPAVARFFDGKATAARLALINGTPGLVWQHAGQVRTVFAFSIAGERVTGIELRSDPDYLADAEVTLLRSGLRAG